MGIIEISAQGIERSWRAKPASHAVGALPTPSWWDGAPEARTLAEAIHAGQTRHGSSDPYFSHLAETAMVIGIFHAMGLLDDQELPSALACAWLHDSMEDQNYPKQKIAQAFGIQAAEIVDSLSKRDGPPSFDAMADSLSRILMAGKIAALVKAADRISNISGAPPPAWSSKKVLAYGRQGLAIASALSPALPKQAQKCLENVAKAYLARIPSASAAPKP